MKKVSERKERIDKKVDIKPTVPIHLYKCVENLADISGRPIKDVVEYIIIEGIESKKVLEFISQYFLRDYWHENTLYKGNPSLSHNRYIRKLEPCKRISTRLQKHFVEKIEVFSFSLGMSLSSSTGLLLDTSIKDITIIDSFIRIYTSELNENQKDTLKATLRYIYRNNPFKEQISFMDVVRMLIDEAIGWGKNF